jgi:selenocysteine-specific elongation factor
LPIDRSFSVKGFGAVVTGTLISGEINEADELEILPLVGKVRVRGIQTHGKAAPAARAGQRTAVNLGGVEHSEIERGMVLCEKNALRPTQIFDAEIEVLKTAKKGLKSRQRVRVHIGTLEALARVQILNESDEIAAGEKDFAQLRTEIPVVTIPGERLIIRSYSPQITIAGGQVLDNAAAKHRRKDAAEVRRRLRNLVEAGDDKSLQIKLFLETANENGARLTDLQARTGWRGEILRSALRENIEKKSIIEAESFFIARTPFENLKTKTAAEIENFHRKEPLARGILRETLREKIFAHLAPEIFRGVLTNLENEKRVASEKDIVRLASHNTELSADEKILRERLEKTYQTARLEVPKLEDALSEAIKNTKSNRETARKIFQLLLNSGELVKSTDEFYFSKTEIDALIKKVKDFAAQSSDRLIDVAKFKDIAGIPASTRFRCSNISTANA